MPLEPSCDEPALHTQALAGSSTLLELASRAVISQQALSGAPASTGVPKLPDPGHLLANGAAA